MARNCQVLFDMSDVSQGFEKDDILTLVEDITAFERRGLGENGEKVFKDNTLIL